MFRNTTRHRFLWKKPLQSQILIQKDYKCKNFFKHPIEARGEYYCMLKLQFAYRTINLEVIYKEIQKNEFMIEGSETKLLHDNL